MTTQDPSAKCRTAPDARTKDLLGFLALLLASIGVGWWASSVGAVWAVFFGGLWLQDLVARLVREACASRKDHGDGGS